MFRLPRTLAAALWALTTLTLLPAPLAASTPPAVAPGAPAVAAATAVPAAAPGAGAVAPGGHAVAPTAVPGARAAAPVAVPTQAAAPGTPAAPRSQPEVRLIEKPLAAAPSTAPEQAGGPSRAARQAAADQEATPVLAGAPGRQEATGTARMAGIRWAGDRPDQIEMRSQNADGTWTPWIVAPFTDGGDQPASTTDPVWIGDSQHVEIRATTDGADRTDQLTLVLIDTPSTPEDDNLVGTPVVQSSARTASAATADGTATGAETTVVGSASVTPAAPLPVISRAQWGANEALVNPDYITYNRTIKAAVVHHTATTNNYTMAQTAAQVRGFFYYHVQTNGWNDIGYNALVDKWGRVFEGRAGGLDLPVLRAHALGFNTATFGIAMIGSYDSVTPPAATIRSVSEMIGWKFRIHGVYDSTGTTQLTNWATGTPFKEGEVVTVPRIFGHRDVNYTSCPGNAGYAQLPNIRTQVASRWDLGDDPIGAAAVTPIYPGQIAVHGHAFDPDDETQPLDVQVYVDGALAGTYPANQAGPTAVPGYPNAGRNHYVNQVINATPGSHTVQVYAQNLAGTPGNRVQIASTTVTVPGAAANTPIGAVDAPTILPGRAAKVTGWAFDPDVPTQPIDVHVYVDGPPGMVAPQSVGATNLNRPDVAAAHPQAGSAHGFEVIIPALSPGEHTLWFFALNAAGPAGNPLLKAVKVTVPNGPAGYTYQPVTPVRLLDTRTTRSMGEGETRWLKVAGAGGIPATATAVTLNVTVTNGTSNSFLTAWAANANRPNASSLNWVVGETKANAVTVPIGVLGSVSLYNLAGKVDVLVDVVGYNSAAIGPMYHTVAPTRVLDSRSASQVGPYGTPWGSTQTREVSASAAGVPADAAGVVLNVTATGGELPSYLTVWPAGETRPTASSLNWAPGSTVPNSVTTSLGSNGNIAIYNHWGAVDVVVDVVGYYSNSPGALFFPVAPNRILDSRDSSPWGPTETRTVPVQGRAGVPTAAKAVVANVTVTWPTAPSYLAVWPAGATRPSASSLNWVTDQTTANSVTSPLGTGGLDVYNRYGTTHVIVDVNGYYR